MTPGELRAARLILGLSAEGYARLIGVQGGRTVRRWEAGDREIPGPVIVLTRVLLALPQARKLLGLTVPRKTAL